MNKPAFGASQVGKVIGQRKKTFLIGFMVSAAKTGLALSRRTAAAPIK
jgi:hypothetical protein